MIYAIVLFIYLNFSHFLYIWLKLFCILKLSAELINLILIFLFIIDRSLSQYVQSWICFKIISFLYVIVWHILKSIHTLVCIWFNQWIILLVFYQILYIYIFIMDILLSIYDFIIQSLFFSILSFVINGRFRSCENILYVSNSGRLVSLKNIWVWFYFIHICQKLRCCIVLVSFQLIFCYSLPNNAAVRSFVWWIISVWFWYLAVLVDKGLKKSSKCTVIILFFSFIIELAYFCLA